MSADSWRYLGTVALLAGAYYLTGRLGLLLAVPPGYATAIWPPSGVALAAILVLGYRYCPGVWLGSFAVNLFTSFDPSNAASMLTSGSIAALIAGGAALQAVAGAGLCRRWIVFPNALERARDIGLLLVLGGPIACLINCSVGTGTLVAFGLVPAEKAPLGWLTWWVGDTIGVLVFTPLMLLVGNTVEQVSARRKKVVSLALVTTFAAAIVIFIATRDWDQERRQLAFEKKAALIAAHLRGHMEDYSSAMNAVARLDELPEGITRERFTTFAAGVLALRPGGMKGLTWTPKVTEAERLQFEDRERRQGLEGFRISDRDEQRRPILAAQRDVYYPITYMEPFVPKLLGFDDSSETIRRAALEAARDQGQPRATSRLDITKKDQDDYGMLIFQPVYENGRPSGTVEERRTNIRGFVVGAFVLPDFIAASLRDVEDNDLDVYITDDESPPSIRLLYDSRTPDHKESHSSSAPHTQETYWQTRINVAGRLWTIHCGPDRATANWGVFFVLAGGLLFAGLSGAFIMTVTARTDVVRRLVHERTRQLVESEQALKTSEETFRLAMEHASIGMALVAPDGRWIKVNDALCRLLGYSENELTRTDLQTITHPEDLQADLPYVSQMLEGAIQTYQVERRYRHKNGPIIWTLLSTSLVRHPDGTPKYFISQIQDITQRREMDRLKSEFIATVSHELRTPLTSIAGALGLLSGGIAGQLPQKAADLVGIADQNSKRLIRLINDILDIEKIAAGKMDLHLEIQPLEPIVRQAIEANQAYAANLGVSIELTGSAGEARVRVDRDRLHQVLTNLISNAAKFSPQGSTVSVDVALKSDSARIAVQDRGPGITEEFRGRLFEKFAQADGSDSRRQPGTGLGLSIAKALIDHLGGTIDYQTALGDGTTFFVTLPLCRSSESTAATVDSGHVLPT